MRAQFGEFTLDSASRQLRRDGEVIHISPKAFDVLRTLVERRPTAVSKADLLNLVWPGTFVADASLTMVITEIRRALGDDAQHPRFVRTVHRFGYAFCGEVDEEMYAPPHASKPHAWLVSSGQVLALREGENVVGRAPECDIWLDGAGVSRRHARIVVAGGAATVEDLGSKNGTLVRDVAVRAVTPLSDGDVIQFGSIEARFRSRSQKSATETVRISRP